jgi:hypothetical protein
LCKSPSRHTKLDFATIAAVVTYDLDEQHFRLEGISPKA